MSRMENQLLKLKPNFLFISYWVFLLTNSKEAFFFKYQSFFSHAVQNVCLLWRNDPAKVFFMEIFFIQTKCLSLNNAEMVKPSEPWDLHLTWMRAAIDTRVMYSRFVQMQTTFLVFWLSHANWTGLKMIWRTWLWGMWPLTCTTFQHCQQSPFF